MPRAGDTSPDAEAIRPCPGDHLREDSSSTRKQSLHATVKPAREYHPSANPPPSKPFDNCRSPLSTIIEVHRRQFSQFIVDNRRNSTSMTHLYRSLIFFSSASSVAVFAASAKKAEFCACRLVVMTGGRQRPYGGLMKSVAGQ